MITPQTSQVPPKPFLLMILGFIVIAQSLYIITGISKKQTVVVLSPTPTPEVRPTAGWTEYTSEFYKIKMSYPANIKFSHQNLFPGGDQETVTFENNNGYMSIETGKALTLSTLPVHSIVTILGSSIKRYDNSVGGLYQKYIMNVPLKEEGKSFVVTIQTKSETVAEDLKLFDQILSTFKFTDNVIEGSLCAGFAGTECPQGYTCKVENTYPDAGGKCIKN